MAAGRVAPGRGERDAESLYARSAAGADVHPELVDVDDAGITAMLPRKVAVGDGDHAAHLARSRERFHLLSFVELVEERVR